MIFVHSRATDGAVLRPPMTGGTARTHASVLSRGRTLLHGIYTDVRNYDD